MCELDEISKQLSWKPVCKFRADKELYGYEPEELMPYSKLPYLINGIKQCRRYKTGIGFQQINEIMILR